LKINKIQVWDFRPPFRDGPYEMANFSQSTAYGRILRVSTNKDIYGLGEIVFSPYASTNEMQALIDEETTFLPQLVGREIECMTEMITEFQNREKLWRGIAFGMETAVMDIMAQLDNQPLTELLGGAQTDAINDYFSISERTAGKITERMLIAGKYRKVIQLKIGVGTIEDDMSHVRALLDNLSEEQVVLADANNGWSVRDACRVIEEFDDQRIVWEEPCATYDENVEVSNNTGRSIMLDQCIGSYEMATRAIEERIVGSICIKPAFLGGLSVAREVRDKAAKAQIHMRIDGPWCGDIASAAILHLAIGTPPELLIAGCDLREPMIIEPDLCGVRNVSPCRIGPPVGKGLGITASASQLGPPQTTYS